MSVRDGLAIGLLCLAPGAWCQRLSLSVGGGAGPAAGDARSYPDGREARPEVGATLLLNAGIGLLSFRGARLEIEVPVAVHGSRSSDVFTSGAYAGFYKERQTATITPGLKVRFASDRRLSPWASFGAGLAAIRRMGNDFQFAQPAASQSDSNLTLALAPAAGIDIRFASRWFVRGELRNYLYRTPATGFVSSFPYWNRWNYNPVVAASIGFRLPL